MIRRVSFIVLVAAAAAGLWLARSSIPDTHRPVALGLASTLALSLLVWPLSAWARSGWSPNPPAGLEGVTGGHDRPGPLMIGVFEALVFYAAFVSAAWAVAGGWLVFKGASKWAAWQHIMKVPDRWAGACSESHYFIFRRDWSSMLLTSFLFGTLANVAVAFVGATVARVLANMPLQLAAFGGG